jgi:hypothetical protein
MIYGCSTSTSRTALAPPPHHYATIAPPSRHRHINPHAVSAWSTSSPSTTAARTLLAPSTLSALPTRCPHASTSRSHGLASHALAASPQLQRNLARSVHHHTGARRCDDGAAGGLARVLRRIRSTQVRRQQRTPRRWGPRHVAIRRAGVRCDCGSAATRHARGCVRAGPGSLA